MLMVSVTCNRTAEDRMNWRKERSGRGERTHKGGRWSTE